MADLSRVIVPKGRYWSVIARDKFDAMFQDLRKNAGFSFPANASQDGATWFIMVAPGDTFMGSWANLLEHQLEPIPDGADLNNLNPHDLGAFSVPDPDWISGASDLVDSVEEKASAIANAGSSVAKVAMCAGLGLAALWLYRELRHE